MDDYSRAINASSAFDAQISAAGTTISSGYADILALASRQIFGTLEITVSQEDSGNYNMSDVMVFCKNFGLFGSDMSGTSQSINSVDALYASFPAYLYLNPEIGGYLLRPLLETMDTSDYTLGYAARNAGTSVLYDIWQILSAFKGRRIPMLLLTT